MESTSHWTLMETRLRSASQQDLYKDRDQGGIGCWMSAGIGVMGALRGLLQE